MKISEYIRNQVHSVSDFAAELGVSEQAVYKWASGQRKPSKKNIPKIVAHTKGKLSYESLLSDTT